MNYSEELFNAVGILIDKKIESIKFDTTITATIIDDSKATNGEYLVDNGSSKFYAYTSETKYKNNDVVMVTIPQGDYEKQKIIIGKQADKGNSPLTYTPPLATMVDMTNNLITNSVPYGMFANQDKNITNEIISTRLVEIDTKNHIYSYPSCSWDSEIEKFQDSQIFLYNKQPLWDSAKEAAGVMFTDKTRLGLSAQFCSYLGQYRTVAGNYGLALAIDFKCLDIVDGETSSPDDLLTKNVFTKFVTLDCKNFFGDPYNFPTYYMQQAVFDISEYIKYPIVRLRLYPYQRCNFYTMEGTEIPAPANMNIMRNQIQNIWIKDPMICLGTSIAEFEKDTASLRLVANGNSVSINYDNKTENEKYTDEEKASLGEIINDPLVNYWTYKAGTYAISDTDLDYNYYKTNESVNLTDLELRKNNNIKIITLDWIHDYDSGPAAVRQASFPENYEVRWYRYAFGAKSPDPYAGPYWERFYGCYDTPNSSGDYAITKEDISDNKAKDIATNRLVVKFNPNVNKNEERLKVVILESESVPTGTFSNENNVLTANTEKIWHLTFSTNAIVFMNETDLRSVATYRDMNALSIRFEDELRGHYFIYNRAGEIHKQSDLTVRTLTAVFDENETDVYKKPDISVLGDLIRYVKWTFPENATMIIPATTTDKDTAQKSSLNEIIWDRDKGDKLSDIPFEVGYFIKKTLDRSAINNTVFLDVIIDDNNYSAEGPMIFGTAGTNGSDYTLDLAWNPDEYALDVSETEKATSEIHGTVSLYKSDGTLDSELADISGDYEINYDWAVSEFIELGGNTDINQIYDFQYQDQLIYYPVFFNSEIDYGNTFQESLDSLSPKFLDGSINSQNEYLKFGGYYYFLETKEAFQNALNELHIRAMAEVDTSITDESIKNNQYAAAIEADTEFSYAWFDNDIKGYRPLKLNLKNYVQFTQGERLDSIGDASFILDSHSQWYRKRKVVEGSQSKVVSKNGKFYQNLFETFYNENIYKYLYEEELFSNDWSIYRYSLDEFIHKSTESSIFYYLIDTVENDIHTYEILPLYELFIQQEDNFLNDLRSIIQNETILMRCVLTPSGVGNYKPSNIIQDEKPLYYVNRNLNESGQGYSIASLSESGDSYVKLEISNWIGENYNLYETIYYMLTGYSSFAKKVFRTAVTSGRTININQNINDVHYYAILDEVRRNNSIIGYGFKYLINNNQLNTGISLNDIFFSANPKDIYLAKKRITNGYQKFQENTVFEFAKPEIEFQIIPNITGVPVDNDTEAPYFPKYAPGDADSVWWGGNKATAKNDDFYQVLMKHIFKDSYLQNRTVNKSFVDSNIRELKQANSSFYITATENSDTIIPKTSDRESVLYNKTVDWLYYYYVNNLKDYVNADTITQQEYAILNKIFFNSAISSNDLLSLMSINSNVKFTCKSDNDSQSIAESIYFITDINNKTYEIIKDYLFSNSLTAQNQCNNYSTILSMDNSRLKYLIDGDESFKNEFANNLNDLNVDFTDYANLYFNHNIRSSEEILNLDIVGNNDTAYLIQLSDAAAGYVTIPKFFSYNDNNTLKTWAQHFTHYNQTGTNSKRYKYFSSDLIYSEILLLLNQFFGGINESLYPVNGGSAANIINVIKSNALDSTFGTNDSEKQVEYYDNVLNSLNNVKNGKNSNNVSVESNYCYLFNSTINSKIYKNLIEIFKDCADTLDIPMYFSSVYNNLQLFAKNNNLYKVISINNPNNFNNYYSIVYDIFFRTPSSIEFNTLAGFFKNNNISSTAIWSVGGRNKTINTLYLSDKTTTVYTILTNIGSYISTINSNNIDIYWETTTNNVTSWESITLTDFKARCLNTIFNNSIYSDLITYLNNISLTNLTLQNEFKKAFILGAIFQNTTPTSFNSEVKSQLYNSNDTFGQIKQNNYIDIINNNGVSILAPLTNYIHITYNSRNNQIETSYDESNIINLIKEQLFNDDINNTQCEILQNIENNEHFNSLYELLFKSSNTIAKDILTQIFTSKDIFWSYYNKLSNDTAGNNNNIGFKTIDSIEYQYKENYYQIKTITESNNILIYEDNIDSRLYYKVLLKLRNLINEACNSITSSYVSTTNSSLRQNLYQEKIFKELRQFFNTNLNLILLMNHIQTEDTVLTENLKNLLTAATGDSATAAITALTNSTLPVDVSLTPKLILNNQYYYVDNNEKKLYNITIDADNFEESLSNALNKTILKEDNIPSTSNYANKSLKEVVALLFNVENYQGINQKTIFKNNIEALSILAEIRSEPSLNIRNITYIRDNETFTLSNELYFTTINDNIISNNTITYLPLQTVLNILNILTTSSTQVYLSDSASETNLPTSSKDSIVFNYDNSLGIKPFIKVEDMYVLDESEAWNQELTYYYPIQKPRVVHKVPPLSFSTHGTHNQYITIYPTDSNNTSEKLMLSLSVLKVTLSNFGDYDLVSYFPIALKNGTKKNQTTGTIEFTPNIMIGATSVRYSTMGETDYERNPYALFATSYDESAGFKNANLQKQQGYQDDVWSVFYSTVFDGDKPSNFLPTMGEGNGLLSSTNRLFTPQPSLIVNGCQSALLQPIRVYIPDAPNYGVMYWHRKSGDSYEPYWSQPIWVYEDNYPSTTINKWNGKDITTDEETGTILASAFAAGKKEQDNTFTGVMLGDWGRTDTDSAITKQTGIFGFNHGSMSYAFKDDGTGFIGKDGRGRIYFDGNSSTITSSNWYGSKAAGMFLDIDDGIIKLQSDPLTIAEFQRVNDFVLFNPYFYYQYDDENKTKKELTANNFIIQNNQYRLYDPENSDNSKTYLGLNDSSESNINDIVDVIISDIQYQKYKNLIQSTNDKIQDKINLLAIFYNQLSIPMTTNVYIRVENGYQGLGNAKWGAILTDLKNYPRQDDYLYVPTNTGNQKYITLSAAEPLYPLSIGTTIERSKRNFKISWDGSAYLSNAYVEGTISGSNIIGSSIKGSIVEADLFQGDYGTIGGWQITPTGLLSADMSTILSPTQGIVTNNLKFVTPVYEFMSYEEQYNCIKSGQEIPSPEKSLEELGSFGFRIGSNTSIDTNTLGLTSNHGMKLKSANGGMSFESTTGFFFENKSATETSAQFKIDGIPADRQYGVYARFA